MKTERIKQLLATEPKNQDITLYGWIRTTRDSKGFCFIELNDGSTITNFQVFLDKSKQELASLIPQLSTGSSIEVKGKLVKSPKPEQPVELHADSITILGKSPAEDYPLQKKRHSFEFLREIAHLRPRTNTFGAVMRVRNALSYAIHSFFQERGFFYIHTPIITGSDCEGAGEMFQVTTLPLEKIPLTDDGKVDYGQDFFAKRTSLTVSGQLEGEIFACSLGNVYTFGPTFRAEHSLTSRHLAEFWMVEPEMAFCDINENMDTAEEFLKYIFNYLLDNCAQDMDFFNARIDNTILDNLKFIIKDRKSVV
jgi:asparaginyl-tRNA synthetase